MDTERTDASWSNVAVSGCAITHVPLQTGLEPHESRVMLGAVIIGAGYENGRPVGPMPGHPLVVWCALIQRGDENATSSSVYDMSTSAEFVA